MESGPARACNGLSDAYLVAARIGNAKVTHAVWSVPDGNDHRDARIDEGNMVVVHAGYAEIDMRRSRGPGARPLRESDLEAIPANGRDVGRVTPRPCQIEPERMAVEIQRLRKVVHRQDRRDGLAAAKAAEIEQWLEQVAASYNVLPMDAAAFREWGKLTHRKSDTLLEDAMIAATARPHNLIVVTRNVADFKMLGVKTLNPFKGSGHRGA